VGVIEGTISMAADGTIAQPAEAQAGASGNVGYEVDRDRIPTVIADLRRALASLEAAGNEAIRHQHVVPPGDDPFSPKAAQQMGPELVANYLEANRRDKASIQALIDNLNAAMRRYDVQDDAAAQALQA
jgi:predicted transcriptional regulator